MPGHDAGAGFESLWTGEHVVLPDPQAPKVKARKIRVNEMGKPTKIETSISRAIRVMALTSRE